MRLVARPRQAKRRPRPIDRAGWLRRITLRAVYRAAEASRSAGHERRPSRCASRRLWPDAPRHVQQPPVTRATTTARPTGAARPPQDGPQFNHDDRPRGPRPAYGAPRGARPFRPRTEGASDSPRPAFNRDDRPRAPRPAYGASRPASAHDRVRRRQASVPSST